MRDPLAQVPIRYKLPLGFLAVCLVAFGIGGVVLTSAAGEALERQIERRLDERIAATQIIVERHLDLVRRRAEDFASDGFIRTEVARLAAEPQDARALTVHLRDNKLPLDAALVGATAYSAAGQPLAWLPEGRPAAPDRALPHETQVGALEGARAGQATPTFAVWTPIWSLAGQRHIGTLALVVDADRWVGAMRELNALPPSPLHLARLRHPKGATLSLSEAVRPPATLSAAEDVGSRYRRAVGGTDWILEMEVDRARAMAPAARLRSQYYLIGALLLAATAILLFFPLRFLLAPLSQFAEAARRIAKGDFRTRVAHESGDEIGDLANAFNLMAGAVEDQTQQLTDAATRLRQREQQIRTERNRLDAVIRGMEHGLFMLDSQGAVSLANEAAQPLLDELEARSAQPQECVHEDTKAAGCLTCLSLGDTGRQACIVEADGRLYDLHVTSLPAASGEAGARLCVSRDVTERIARQETQAHQERMAVLGEVAAVMAHELNNPLAAISIFAELLEEGVADDAQLSENVRVIRRNAAACKSTIGGLLDLAARGRFEVTVFDIHDLLEEVQALLGPLAQRKGTEIHVAPGARHSELVGDEGRLRQVFVNLVMNAIQACDKPGRVKIKTQDTEQGIEVEVSDNGRGIPEDVQARVFEPFFTTKRAGRGTGLGLPTSRRIVEEHGGTLELAHSGPSGTSFSVSLMRKAARRLWEARARQEASVSPSSDAAQSGSPS